MTLTIKRIWNTWKKYFPTPSGTCFLITFDNLERLLKYGEIPSNWRLKEGEFVEIFQATEEGIRVYVGTKAPEPINKSIKKRS